MPDLWQSNKKQPELEFAVIIDFQTFNCTESKPATLASGPIPNYTPGQQFTSARLTKKNPTKHQPNTGRDPGKGHIPYYCLPERAGGVLHRGRSKSNPSVPLTGQSKTDIAASKLPGYRHL